MRAYEIITEDQQLNEFWPLIVAWTPEILAALATGVRVAAPYVARGLGVAVRNPVKTGVGAVAATHPEETGKVIDAAQTAYNVATDPQAAAAAAAKSVAQQSASLVDNAQAAATVAAKGAWHSAEAAANDIAEIVGNNLTPDKIQQLADAAIEYALPAAVVVAILYGGKMLYDHMKASSQHQAKTA